MAKRRITPEQRAQWAEDDRRLAALMATVEARLRRRGERRARRRQRLERVTFGLLAR